MKPILKNIFYITFILILIVLFLLLIVNNKEDITRLTEIKPAYIFIIVVLILLELYINGLLLNIMTLPFNIKLSIREWLNLAVITTLGNYLTFFKGGSSTKAVYLKKKHNLNFSDFFASNAASYIISIFIYGIIGSLFIILFSRADNAVNIILLLIFLIMAISPLVAIFYFPKFRESNNKFFNFFIRIISGWNLLRKNKKFMLSYSFFAIILFFIAVLKFYFIFSALSYNITFIDSMFIALLSTISGLISITPASLGIRESIVAISTEIIDIGLKAGIYASALDRALTILVLLLIGPISAYLLFRRLGKFKYGNNGSLD